MNRLRRRLTLITLLETALPAVIALLALVPATFAGEPLPIIPGAKGFGMETPAGSGRHLADVSLKPDWDASLVGHWNFDKGIPKGAALAGQAAIVKRGKGRALSLNGKGHLKLANAKGYVKPGASFTIMAWAYMKAPGGSVAGNSTNDGGFWQLRHTAGFGGKWQFAVRNAARIKHHAEWNDYTTAGVWRHVAGAYDSATGRIRLYLNGKMVHNGWDKATSDLAAARSCNLLVGNGVRGVIDDVMLFDRLLKVGEIAALYATQHASYFASRTELYRVVNLNDSGPGSLREGIDGQERARTIVFEVSGTIALKRGLSINNRNCYLTIAGHTAPSPGITIANHGVSIGGTVNDILIQHIRLRTGDLGIPPHPTKSQMPDPLSISPGTRNLVVDHCSMSWGTDMNLMTGADNATFSNLISSEALGTPLHPKGPHSKGFYVLSYHKGGHGGKNTAIIGNLIAFNWDRNPTISAGSAVVANNYLHACGPNGAFMVDDHAGIRKGPVQASFVGNVIKQGGLAIALRSGVNPESRFYLSSDNIFNDKVIANPWKSRYVRTSYPWPKAAALPAHKIAATREDAIWIAGYEPMPANQVKDYVLKNVGARPADRDPVDKRIISKVKRGKGKIIVTRKDIIASQKDVGGWPNLAENHRKLTMPESPDADDDGDGYTNLEEWLHGYAAEVEGRTAAAAATDVAD